jgi:hypothetical protein
MFFSINTIIVIAIITDAIEPKTPPQLNYLSLDLPMLLNSIIAEYPPFTPT